MMTEIVPGLYVGSMEARRHVTAAQVQVVFSLGHGDTDGSRVFAPLPLDIIEHTFELRADRPSLMAQLEDAFEFFEDAARKNLSVLVHCMSGVSRAPALAAAILVARRGYTAEAAVALVTAKRPLTRILPVYMDVLRRLERAPVE